MFRPRMGSMSPIQPYFCRPTAEWSHQKPHFFTPSATYGRPSGTGRCPVANEHFLHCVSLPIPIDVRVAREIERDPPTFYGSTRNFFFAATRSGSNRVWIVCGVNELGDGIFQIIEWLRKTKNDSQRNVNQSQGTMLFCGLRKNQSNQFTLDKEFPVAKWNREQRIITDSTTSLLYSLLLLFELIRI